MKQTSVASITRWRWICVCYPRKTSRRRDSFFFPPWILTDAVWTSNMENLKNTILFIGKSSNRLFNFQYPSLPEGFSIFLAVLLQVMSCNITNARNPSAMVRSRIQAGVLNNAVESAAKPRGFHGETFRKPKGLKVNWMKSDFINGKGQEDVWAFGAFCIFVFGALSSCRSQLFGFWILNVLKTGRRSQANRSSSKWWKIIWPVMKWMPWRPTPWEAPRPRCRRGWWKRRCITAATRHLAQLGDVFVGGESQHVMFLFWKFCFQIHVYNILKIFWSRSLTLIGVVQKYHDSCVLQRPILWGPLYSLVASSPFRRAIDDKPKGRQFSVTFGKKGRKQKLGGRNLKMSWVVFWPNDLGIWGFWWLKGPANLSFSTVQVMITTAGGIEEDETVRKKLVTR